MPVQVLPPHVDAELAVKEGWWKDPNYILNELNINSTISSPAHDERVYLDQNRPYLMKGYAYSGGGRKITRVEVSFDGGAFLTAHQLLTMVYNHALLVQLVRVCECSCTEFITGTCAHRRMWDVNGTDWVSVAGETFSKPAKLIITEKPNEFGKYWTWVHWELEVKTMDFFMAKEVVCRAWDESQNTQPDVLTWTLLGQGNNSMFRLRLHKDVDDKVSACIHTRQLPTLPEYMMH